jgi:hypothetical protein
MILVILLTTFSQCTGTIKSRTINIAVDNLTCVCINEALGNSRMDAHQQLYKKTIFQISDTKTLDLYKEFQNLKPQITIKNDFN